MSNLAFFGEPRVPRLAALLREIQSGQIRVPKFQRPFVWTGEQQLELMQSIYNRYPIGSILVWRTTSHRLASYDRLGPIRLPPDVDPEHGVVRQYLLDGHQRLATLFAALGPGLPAVNFDRIRGQGSPLVVGGEDGWDEEDGGRWPIYLDLESEDDDRFRFRGRRGAPRKTWLPLSILFDSFKLRDFEAQLKSAKASAEIVNRVQYAADVFRDYIVPVMPIATDDLAQVTTSFKRVNSGGTPMSEVHMVNALTWRPTFDFQDRLEVVLTQLGQVGWSSIDPQLVLNLCKIKFNLEIHGTDIERLARLLDKAPNRLAEVADRLSDTAQLLAETVGVMSPRSLPYAYQAVLLADALPASRALKKAEKRRIHDWFWITSLTEYFRGLTNSSFGRAKAHLADAIAGKKAPRPPDASESIDLHRRFDFRSARSRALAIIMAERGAMSPQRSSADARVLLGELGTDSVLRIFTRPMLGDSDPGLAEVPENRIISHPRQLQSLLAILQRPGSEDIAESHGISAEARAALVSGDQYRFLQLRRTTLESLEESKARSVGLVRSPSSS